MMTYTRMMRGIDGASSSDAGKNPQLTIVSCEDCVRIKVEDVRLGGVLDAADLPALIAFLQACQVELARR